MANRVDLLVNVAATGAAMDWQGGSGTFMVVGTFTGATVTLQMLGPDNTTYVAVSAATTVTAACCVPFQLPNGTIRALVAGGTPSGLYASAIGMRQAT